MTFILACTQVTRDTVIPWKDAVATDNSELLGKLGRIEL